MNIHAVAQSIAPLLLSCAVGADSAEFRLQQNRWPIDKQRPSRELHIGEKP